MKPSVTPLRYPGGKTWLLGYLKRFLEFHHFSKLDLIIEPYAGSAAIAVGLLEENLAERAILCEKDELIVSFLESVKFEPDELIDFIQTVEVSLNTWNSLKRFLSVDACKRYSSLDLAKALIFYNRTNYSGIIIGGPIGGMNGHSRYGIDCRFNRGKIIQKIRQLCEISDRIEIVQGDGLQFMRSLSTKPLPDHSLFYVDPPYYVAGRDLYRYFFKLKDHISLANFLRKLDFPWLLSYDDAQFIRNLYSNLKWQPIYADHQAGSFKKGVMELLVSNMKIPPEQYNQLKLENIDDRMSQPSQKHLLKLK